MNVRDRVLLDFVSLGLVRDPILDLLQDWQALSEARASCALDGETQSFPEANAFAFVLMPDGSLKSFRVFDQAIEDRLVAEGWKPWSR